MRIGIPKEIKSQEHRIALTPAGAKALVQSGHEVLVQRQAGLGSGFPDTDYSAVGARIGDDAEQVFAFAELLIKVKEPQLQECRLLKPHQVLFAYLHLAADPEQIDALCESGATAIAFETVTAADGTLPLLRPMSEIAGRIATQAGASSLQKNNGGAGVLLGGVSGVAPSKVVVLGGGVAGRNALDVALGMGAAVTVVDKSVHQLQKLAQQFGEQLTTTEATPKRIASLVADADLVIGAVLIPGATAPRLVSREMLKTMRPGSVLVDIAIDQGGCFETSRPTTLAEPTYLVEGIVHYCVANMPSAVPRTATLALSNTILPFAIALADRGWERACADDTHLAAGVNISGGAIRHPAVAAAHQARTL